MKKRDVISFNPGVNQTITDQTIANQTSPNQTIALNTIESAKLKDGLCTSGAPNTLKSA